MTENAELTIGAFARQAGISIDTARFYERVGLLTPRRQANNYRLYGIAELERMRWITNARAAGFSLNEIGGLLEFMRNGKRACSDYEPAARNKLAALDEQIRSLLAMRRELKRGMRDCSPRADECGFFTGRTRN